MPLTMSRPSKHPKTGIYWLRRVVPVTLRAAVGKREEKRSLGTRDPEEARRRHARAMVELDEKWANLRAGERSLSEREANELARPLSAKFLHLYSDDPSHQPWYPECYDELVLTKAYDAADDAVVEEVDGNFVRERRLDSIQVESMRRFASAQAQYVLDALGMRVDPYSHLKLVRACAIALQRASLILAEAERSGESLQVDDPAELEEQAKNDVPPPTIMQPSPSRDHITGSQRGSADKAITLTGLLAAWWEENRRAGLKQSTYESYSHAVNSFAAFLGHDDAGRVTPDDVVAFKDYRLTTASSRTGRAPSAKTVKDSDLAGLKTVFRWAVNNRKISINPTTGVTIKVIKSPKLRSKGFSDEEAKALLLAACSHKKGLEAHTTWAAKRWIPWLCAFTGARVGELAQLRKQDVTLVEGQWILLITPEAGTVKTNQARPVVLHPQVVELGFPSFVKEAPPGHLFLKPQPDGNVLKPLQTLKNRLAEFGRKTVTDINVAPNHGWRHRFKTVGREVEIHGRVLDAIQGHAPQNVSDKYGDVTLKTIAAAIQKLPWYDIG